MADAPHPVPEIGSDYDPVGFGPAGSGDSTPTPGIRRVNFRAVIDTNPPFGSVKEAVTRFGGSGPWIPFCKEGIEQFDIKRMEEETAELEKDLIVKELETLDVLEELGATKRMVEELKRQLKIEALKSFHMLGDSSPSPNMILMELKQAKMNLSKTINDLSVIQTSVESLNRKMKKEKSLLATRRAGAPPKFVDKELKPTQGTQSNDVEFKDVSVSSFNTDPRLSRMGRDRSKAGSGETGSDLRRAELRLVAARKMEEAAKAAEAVALAEVEALSNIGFSLQEPDTMGFNFKEQLDEANSSKLEIAKKLKEAKEELNLGKKALEEALNRVEVANKKQLVAEETLRRMVPGPAFYCPSALVRPPGRHGSPLHDGRRADVVRSNISMRDVLGRKQGLLSGEKDNQKVDLSQMLNLNEQKNVTTERKRFGFIHIALPMMKQSKKKSQSYNKT